MTHEVSDDEIWSGLRRRFAIGERVVARRGPWQTRNPGPSVMVKRSARLRNAGVGSIVGVGAAVVLVAVLLGPSSARHGTAPKSTSLPSGPLSASTETPEASSAVTASPAPSSSPQPQTAAGRTRHTATLLEDGRVLITGGQSGTEPIPLVSEDLRILASAVLYDPGTGKLAATGSMTTWRWGESATLLPDGKVLVAGGLNGTGFLKSAELYDPETGKFSVTGQMTLARSGHTATLLPSGLVLLVGGEERERVRSAELYDPRTGLFTRTGTMTVTTRVDTATLLANGSVLVTGSFPVPASNGEYQPSAEIYDPLTGKFSLAGSMSVARSSATATLLLSGKVLIAGGCSPDIGQFPSTSCPIGSAELYDPATDSFTLLTMNMPRRGFTATRLPDGRVLLAGGYSGSLQDPYVITSTAELYDPATGTFAPTGQMTIGRANQTATLLANGRVLIVGGEDISGGLLRSLSSSEIYDPNTGTFTETASLTDAP